MQLIIDLLLDNIVYVIIVLGALSSLISKMRGTQQTNPKQPGNGMPPFGGDAPLGVPADAAPEKTRPARTIQTVRVEQSPPPAEAHLPEMANPMTEGQGRSGEAPDRSTGYGSALVAAGSARDGRTQSPALLAHQAELDQHEIARGMMWAEILSPPRAKRPYPFRR